MMLSFATKLLGQYYFLTLNTKEIISDKKKMISNNIVLNKGHIQKVVHVL